MELYSAAGRSVKCWDAIKGIVIVLKNFKL